MKNLEFSIHKKEFQQWTISIKKWISTTTPLPYKPHLNALIYSRTRTWLMLFHTKPSVINTNFFCSILFSKTSQKNNSKHGQCNSHSPICVSTCLTYIPVLVANKKLNEKFSARWLLYCCCFLGNIPETEDENLRKPLKHTILILHSTLSTSFYFWGGCAHTIASVSI